MSEAPERVGVKLTEGYERNWWGVITHEFDEEGVVYVREEIADQEAASLRTALVEERKRALEAEEKAGMMKGYLSDALPLLDHLSRETTTDHIGDDWLTQRAVRARKVSTAIRALKEKGE